MSLHVDRELCQGHGKCYGYFPEAFLPDDEGLAHVRTGAALGPEDTELAVNLCPERAISACHGSLRGGRLR